MVEIRALDVGDGALRDCPKIGGERFRIALLETLIAFAQRFRDGAGHGLAGGLGDGLGETVGLRVFDVEARGSSILLYDVLPFFITARFPLPDKEDPGRPVFHARVRCHCMSKAPGRADAGSGRGGRPAEPIQDLDHVGMREDGVGVALERLEVAPGEAVAELGGRKQAAGLADQPIRLGRGDGVAGVYGLVDQHDQLRQLAEPGEGGMVQNQVEQLAGGRDALHVALVKRGFGAEQAFVQVQQTVAEQRETFVHGGPCGIGGSHVAMIAGLVRGRHTGPRAEPPVTRRSQVRRGEGRAHQTMDAIEAAGGNVQDLSRHRAGYSR